MYQLYTCVGYKLLIGRQVCVTTDYNVCIKQYNLTPKLY